MGLIRKLLLYPAFHTRLLALLMMLCFIDYSGYGYYVFYLSIIYLLFHKVHRYVDKSFFLLLLWGLSYGIINMINTMHISYLDVLFPIINCSFLYLGGKYLAVHNNKEGIVNLLFLFVSSIAFISLLSIFLDILDKGFFVIGLDRNIQLLGIHNTDGYIAATGISSRLLPLASLVVFFILPLSVRMKIVVVTLALLAIYCGVRIQSRTMVVAIALFYFIVAVWNWSCLSFRNKFFLLLSFIIIVLTVFYFVITYSTELAIIDRFQSDEFDTGGGRLPRLLNVASKMCEYPAGNMPKSIPYAHNLWFDVARVSGIFPFILLIIITLKYVSNLFRFFSVFKNEITLCNFFLIISLSMFINFIAEPILEGIPVIFGLFCLLFGMIVQMNNTNKIY